MDHPSSPHPPMSGYVEASRAAKDIRKKNGDRVRKPSQVLRTPYDACTKVTFERTRNKETCCKRERLIDDEIQAKIDILKEEDAVIIF